MLLVTLGVVYGDIGTSPMYTMKSIVANNGGIGTVPGVVIGSIILQAINYGLYFLGVNAYLQYIIRGAIIIIAVAIDVQKYVAKK